MEGEESARLSYTLATIDTCIPLDFNPVESAFKGFSGVELYEALHRLGFNRFIERWKLSPGEDAGKKGSSQALPYYRRGGRANDHSGCSKGGVCLRSDAGHA
jgi:hypothetical protein